MVVNLTPELEKIVQEQLAAGKFHTVEEVIAEALRLMLLNQRRLELLRQELLKGEQSGDPIPYTPALLDEIEQEALAELEAGKMEIDPSVWPETAA